MDFNAIQTFLDNAFFSNNTPTHIDVFELIKFYKEQIIINKVFTSDIKQFSSKVLKIPYFCKEIYFLFELVFSGLIIHCSHIDDQIDLENYYYQWIWSRYLINRVITNTITDGDKDLLFNFAELKRVLNKVNNVDIKSLIHMRHLFVPLYNMSIESIILFRSNIEKSLIYLITHASDWKNSPLMQPYDSLPFLYTQPSYALTYHNANNSTLFGLQGQFYRILLEVCYKDIPFSLPLQSQIKSQSTELVNSDEQNKIKKKVGFLSRTFNNHSVGRMTIGLVEQLHKYEDIEIYLYTIHDNTIQDNRVHDNRVHDNRVHDNRVHDRFVERYAKSCTNYIKISSNDFIDTVNKIREDKLDVLIIPETIVDIYTYLISQYKCAPLQLTTWGHPDTSGSQNIDYYITSKLFEKNIDNIYYEKPYLMNSLSFYYYDLNNTYGFDPVEMFKDISKEILREQLQLPINGHIYGIISSMYKFHPSFDCIINSILHYDQNAQIVIIKGVNNVLYDKVVERLTKTINNQYINRITVTTYKTEMYSYEKFLLACDVILDTFPFGGCISTFDTISCNKCMITLPGNKLYGRFTQGLYKYMDAGLEDHLIAKDENNYIELALRVATYPALRRSLEKKIKDNKNKIYENRESIEEWYQLISSN